MKCQGKFVFRGLEKKDGGEFVNDKGQSIKYGESYVLLLDEFTKDGNKERKFKIPTNSPIIEKLQGLKLYTVIPLEFEVTIYATRTVLVPVDVLSNK